jgi:hypothetical protein
MTELSDADVFGSGSSPGDPGINQSTNQPPGTSSVQPIQDTPRELSDDEVFGSASAGKPQPLPNGAIGDNKVPVNQQDNLLNKIDAWANSPTSVDLSDLSSKAKEANLPSKIMYAGQALGRGLGATAEDLIVKPTTRGLTSMMKQAAGEYSPETDSSAGSNLNLSPDALQDLMMMSPVNRAAGMAEGMSAPRGVAIGNRALNAAADYVKQGADTLGVKDFLTDEGTTAGKAADFNTAQAARPTQAQIRNIAGRAFDKADEMGGMMAPEDTNGWLARVGSASPATSEGKLMAGENDATKYIERMQSLQDKPLSYTAVDEIDKDLTSRIQGERNADGTLTPTGQKFYQIQTELRSGMSNPIGDSNTAAFQARRDAQGLWAQQARLGDVQRAFERGSSREIPITGIRNEFRSIQQNPSRYNLYTPDEQKYIDQLAGSSLTADMVRTAGSRLMNYIAIGHGNPLGIAASQIGTHLARDFGSSLKTGPLIKLQDQILSRQELPVLDKPYQSRGGAINMKKGGRVLARPKSYPALEARRST